MDPWKPFHEAIIPAIKNCSRAGLVDMARLIRNTSIPKDHDKIILAWEERLEQLDSKPNRGVRASIQKQKDKLSSFLKKEFFFLVDYSLSLEEVIDQVPYSFIGEDINSENFSFKPKPKFPVAKLFYIDKVSSSDIIIIKMKRAGFRPANLFELASFMVFSKNVVEELSVVALESDFEKYGNKKVACGLTLERNRKEIILENYNSMWFVRYSFLGIKI
ncbi:MAG: hypothetical protein WC928_02420 [Patescibacteria group bacterium]|jgi:hypothetical protein